jgi:hypothetical protein
LRLALLLASILLTGAFGTALAGTPIKAAAYVAELQTERLYRVPFRWDGVGQLSIGPIELIATTSAGGGVHFADEFAYVTGAGNVTRVHLASGQLSSVPTFNNANACSADPARQFLYCGWRLGLSRVPLQPLAAGTLVGLSGPDTDLTTLVFTPAHGVFYTNGTELFNGDFGSIDLATGVTQRLQSAAFATGATWDSFSGRVLVAGLGRARLVDPAAPSQISSQRDDSATQNYLSLNPTGRGHAIGTLCCVAEARLVVLDYSANSDLGSPQTLIVSAVLPGLSMLSGEAAFDSDRKFASGFEDNEF